MVRVELRTVNVRQLRSKTRLRTCILCAVLLAFVSGIALLIVGYITRDSALMGFATAAIPASLASSAAVFGVQTWAEVRAQAVDQKSRDALELFISKSALMIVQGLNLEGVDLPMRANIVTWGSPELLGKLSERTRFIDRLGIEFRDEIVRQRSELGDPRATVTINLGPRKAELAVITAEAIALARRDIGLETVTAREIYDVLFGTVDHLSFDEAIALNMEGANERSEARACGGLTGLYLDGRRR